MTDFTHFDKSGKARMVDVGDKPITTRCAIAKGHITMQRATLDAILAGTHKKGDVLGVARLAGIMGAKKTSDLIPLCHPLSITAMHIDFEYTDKPPAVVCCAEIQTHDRTGVEMEALMAVQVALLTIYDMCKSVDRAMTISEVMLVEKRGGKSGTWQRDKEELLS